MCGIAGYFCVAKGQQRPEPEMRDEIGLMSVALHHRGPDSNGAWIEPGSGVALAHRRLAIVDLSQAGHQPMLDASGRWALTFNGEIYNHLTLRADLEAKGRAPTSWRGASDSETLLAVVAAWGVERAVEMAVGMFAFAVFDRREHVLTLARDRMGEKPLYYSWVGDTLIFGSELRALRPYPGFKGNIDRAAVEMLLRFNYIPEPLSIYTGVRRLLPGHFLRVTAGQEPEAAEPTVYWSYGEGAQEGYDAPLICSEEAASDQLEQLLGDAIEGQMMSDVPLGALLSGGIDSSLVVALAQARAAKPLKTFTIGFRESSVDEAHYARAVAEHLGTDHHELQFDSQTALDLVGDLPRIFDEPFGDPSQLPTYLVSRMARNRVTVALSGDGADEIFGGYSRYLAAPALWRQVKCLPIGLRLGMGKLIGALPPRMLGQRGRRIGAALMQSRDMDGIYLASLTQNERAIQMLLDRVPPSGLLLDHAGWPLSIKGATVETDAAAARFMALDATTYLPGDLMAKVDRASMAVALETRAPYLDRNVVELGWRIPQSMKIRGGTTKWILRQVLARYLPRALIERPKMGFGMPIGDWLRGPLRDLAEQTLSEARLRKDGLLNAAVARRVWQLHRDGVEDNANAVWSLLMLQLWLDEAAGAAPNDWPPPPPIDYLQRVRS